MPQRATNTQEEVLRKLLNSITDAELAEDADPAFLTILRSVVKAKLRAPIDQAAAQVGMSPDAQAGLPPSMSGGAGAMGGGAAGAGMPPSLSAGPMAGPAPGVAPPIAAGGNVPGVTSGLNRQAMNPDELRRMLAGPG